MSFHKLVQCIWGLLPFSMPPWGRQLKCAQLRKKVICWLVTVQLVVGSIAAMPVFGGSSHQNPGQTLQNDAQLAKAMASAFLWHGVQEIRIFSRPQTGLLDWEQSPTLSLAKRAWSGAQSLWGRSREQASPEPTSNTVSDSAAVGTANGHQMVRGELEDLSGWELSKTFNAHEPNLDLPFLEIPSLADLKIGTRGRDLVFGYVAGSRYVEHVIPDMGDFTAEPLFDPEGNFLYLALRKHGLVMVPVRALKTLLFKADVPAFSVMPPPRAADGSEFEIQRLSELRFDEASTRDFIADLKESQWVAKADLGLEFNRADEQGRRYAVIDLQSITRSLLPQLLLYVSYLDVVNRSHDEDPILVDILNKYQQQHREFLTQFGSFIDEQIQAEGDWALIQAALAQVAARGGRNMLIKAAPGIEKLGSILRDTDSQANLMASFATATADAADTQPGKAIAQNQARKVQNQFAAGLSRINNVLFRDVATAVGKLLQLGARTYDASVASAKALGASVANVAKQPQAFVMAVGAGVGLSAILANPEGARDLTVAAIGTLAYALSPIVQKLGDRPGETMVLATSAFVFMMGINYMVRWLAARKHFPDVSDMSASQKFFTIGGRLIAHLSYVGPLVIEHVLRQKLYYAAADNGVPLTEPRWRGSVARHIPLSARFSLPLVDELGWPAQLHRQAGQLIPKIKSWSRPPNNELRKQDLEQRLKDIPQIKQTAEYMTALAIATLRKQALSGIPLDPVTLMLTDHIERFADATPTEKLRITLELLRDPGYVAVWDQLFPAVYAGFLDLARQGIDMANFDQVAFRQFLEDFEKVRTRLNVELGSEHQVNMIVEPSAITQVYRLARQPLKLMASSSETQSVRADAATRDHSVAVGEAAEKIARLTPRVLAELSVKAKQFMSQSAVPFLMGEGFRQFALTWMTYHYDKRTARVAAAAVYPDYLISMALGAGMYPQMHADFVALGADQLGFTDRLSEADFNDPLVRERLKDAGLIALTPVEQTTYNMSIGGLAAVKSLQGSNYVIPSWLMPRASAWRLAQDASVGKDLKRQMEVTAGQLSKDVFGFADLQPQFQTQSFGAASKHIYDHFQLGEMANEHAAGITRLTGASSLGNILIGAPAVMAGVLTSGAALGGVGSAVDVMQFGGLGLGTQVLLLLKKYSFSGYAHLWFYVHALTHHGFEYIETNQAKIDSAFSILELATRLGHAELLAKGVQDLLGLYDSAETAAPEELIDISRELQRSLGRADTTLDLDRIRFLGGRALASVFSNVPLAVKANPLMYDWVVNRGVGAMGTTMLYFGLYSGALGVSQIAKDQGYAAAWAYLGQNLFEATAVLAGTYMGLKGVARVSPQMASYSKKRLQQFKSLVVAENAKADAKALSPTRSECNQSVHPD